MSECPKCNGMKIQLSTMTGLSGIWACIDCDFKWTIEAEREIESLKGGKRDAQKEIDRLNQKLTKARARLEEYADRSNWAIYSNENAEHPNDRSGNTSKWIGDGDGPAIAAKGLEESR
jgi:hypothetical protein